MRASPLPSPAEAPSPITAPHPEPSFSVLSLAHGEDGYAGEGITAMDGFAHESHTCSPRGSHEQTAKADADSILSSAIKAHANQEKASHEDSRTSQTLKELRRQMEELLAYQQLQQPQDSNTTDHGEPISMTSAPHKSSMKQRLSNILPPKFTLSSTGAVPPTSHSDSTGSGGTVKAFDVEDDAAKPIGQTPSYPFPKMHMQETTKQPENYTTSPGHFKLTLPAEK
ncbi:hypothetical protein KXX11_001684, partial [Aspergillus fumigatus]